ncbi:MAG: system mannose-specific component [Symbiobacteriaceae bacterium]|nr:system mannose-specific component [Symbiobacteriaceae bacterium]
MSTVTALLLACLAGFAYFSRRFLGDWYLERPIVLGPLVGLIMGDFNTGLIIGGTLELIFMGAADIGGAVPPNYNIGTVVGTALAIASGQGLETALVIAVPAALLGSFFELLAKTFSSVFVNAADRYADRGDDKGIARMMHLGNLFHFLADAVPTFVALSLGTEAVKTMANSIPAWLSRGVGLAGNMLPALGFALLLNSLAPGAMLPFFFIGFLLAAYTNFGVLGIAVLAFLVALVMQSQRKSADEVDEAAIASGAGVSDTMDKADLRTLFYRSFALQSAFSFDRMQALGWTWSLVPVLKKAYKNNPEEYKAALKRHLTFFNTHMWVHGPILAMTADMEIRRGRGEEVDEQAIQGLKGSLMGPLAGIGDSMFHGTLRPIVGGICASLALQGNPIAPVLFFVVVNVVHVYVSYYTLHAGYRFGERAIAMLASGGLRRVMEGASMVGLMAVGALTGSWLNVKTPMVYTVEKAAVKVQTMLDGIMPKILPLVLVMLVFWLVRKQKKTTSIMLGLIAAALILGGFKILA